MLPLFALALIGQQGSLYSRIVPKTTGHNGYEEYLRAADFLTSDEGRAFALYDPSLRSASETLQKPEVAETFRRLSAMEPLTVAREAMRKYGGVLSLIAQGNRKTVTDPRAPIGPSSPFPEFSVFRSIGKIETMAASVYAADGRTDLAVETLVDGLTFSDNIGRFILIGNLSGIIVETNLCRASLDLLPRLSRRDAVRLQRGVETLLAKPPALRQTWRGEIDMTNFVIEQVFSKAIPESELTGNDPGAVALRQANALTATQRENFRRQVASELQRKDETIERIVRGPESGWIAGFGALDDENETKGTTLAESAVRSLSPHHESAAIANVRIRTQLRLLALHARLIQHRWDYGRWPKSVDEIDPLTRDRYIYEVTDGGVRLASRGTPETGEIELRYQRPTRNQESKP